ncbi:MAG: hypothetical protein B6D39_10105 [Anaerolineae bacterium UTCFX2]|jgi:hypothetical protein|nr:hypothetical protein [Anaerolineae bacterium]MCZ7554094.1 hypothetical protein [Anaerolineales bacterium]OQY89311.1 MAG: hypothetical protein B6D39_10105 [Anaerolineae bacterium UTCFX2]
MAKEGAAFSPEPSEQMSLEGLDVNRLELLAVIWEAAESLTSTDTMKRVNGLERLVEFDAIRQLPLVAYLLATRLEEPDIELRTRIVRYLGSLINSDNFESNPAGRVKETLMVTLSNMRTRQIFGLLQVTVYDKTAEADVMDLLSCCSYAGSHLSEILSNRDLPQEIRKQAAFFIGQIGYLDALPVLERMTNRLETRGSEQDAVMLPVLQNAVQLLTAP